MKKLVACLALVALVILSASAATIGNKGVTVYGNENGLTITPKHTDVDVSFEQIEVFSPDFITAAKQFVGLEQKDQAVSVTIENKLTAILPPDSPLLSVPVTEECLYFQYGTDAWLECELMK